MPISVDRGALAYTKTEADNKFEQLANKTTSFQATPDDTKYPTEKLVKDSLNLKANDNAVVHLTGNETIAGVKTFTSNATGANISQLNMGICDTAQATTLKEVTLTGYVPKQGDNFKVLMTNASVASASLRVNEGTTYQIRVASSTTITSSWAANSICEFMLDGGYYFLLSTKPANSTNTPTFYTKISSSSASSTYSTGGILGVNTISNLADNTNKWAYFGTLTMSYNSTYSYGQSVNQCILFNEYSRGEIGVDELEVFQIQIKASMPAVRGSSATFNSTVPKISIDVNGKTNLTNADICALVYSSTTSTKIIRLYVRLKTPDKHYSTNPICYGNNSYRSTGVASTSYITYAGASVQAVIADLPTPAQGEVVYPVVVGKRWGNFKFKEDRRDGIATDDNLIFDDNVVNMELADKYPVLLKGVTYQITWSMFGMADGGEFKFATQLFDKYTGQPILTHKDTSLECISSRVKDDTFHSTASLNYTPEQNIALSVRVRENSGCEILAERYSYLTIAEI